MRIKVWALLGSVGWDRLDMDDDDQAAEAALIVLQMAKKYREFAVASAWKGVKDSLSENGVRAIRPDNMIIENNLETGFDLASQTRYAQLKHVEVLHKKADNAEAERALRVDIADREGEHEFLTQQVAALKVR